MNKWTRPNGAKCDARSNAQDVMSNDIHHYAFSLRRCLLTQSSSEMCRTITFCPVGACQFIYRYPSALRWAFTVCPFGAMTFKLSPTERRDEKFISEFASVSLETDLVVYFDL